MKKEKLVLSNMRKDYQSTRLDRTKMLPNPYEQFEQWLQEAINSEILEANAMALATSNKASRPSLRMVLLKGYKEQQGFFFYTNYHSRKGQELIQNPHAALLFYWDLLERQIRIEGSIQKASPAISDQYFNSRPKKSRIGAIASPQSSILSSRTELEQRVKDYEQQYANTEQIKRPDHWGGFVLIPHTFEFWQGQSSRLHDRFQYRLQETDNTWQLDRLAP